MLTFFFIFRLRPRLLRCHACGRCMCACVCWAAVMTCAAILLENSQSLYLPESCGGEMNRRFISGNVLFFSFLFSSWVKMKLVNKLSDSDGTDFWACPVECLSCRPCETADCFYSPPPPVFCTVSPVSQLSPTERCTFLWPCREGLQSRKHSAFVWWSKTGKADIQEGFVIGVK